MEFPGATHAPSNDKVPETCVFGSVVGLRRSVAGRPFGEGASPEHAEARNLAPEDRRYPFTPPGHNVRIQVSPRVFGVCREPGFIQTSEPFG